MAGWGSEVFSAYNHWWIIPLIATHLGAILGAGLHLLLGNYQQVLCNNKQLETTEFSILLLLHPVQRSR